MPPETCRNERSRDQYLSVLRWSPGTGGTVGVPAKTAWRGDEARIATSEFPDDNPITKLTYSGMSATEIIDELSKLTETERRAVFGKLLELEDLPLSEADEALVEFRLAAHRSDPKSSVPLEEMKRRLRSQS